MKNKMERGFTLVEILLVLLITGIIIGPFYNNLFLMADFRENTTNRLELNQQARLITARLDNKLRNSRDIKLIGDEKIFLNRGPDYSECVVNHCGPETDCYLRLGVNDGQLYVERTGSTFDGSGITYPDWPGNMNMGARRPVTAPIIEEHRFEMVNENLFYYYFKLKFDGQEQILENKLAIGI